MTTETLPTARASRVRHFARHYVEMVVAMVVGMMVLGAVEGVAWPGLTARADVGAMVMATNMAIGMGAWMRFRGHSWRGVIEMSGSMYVPFLVLLVPFWAGAIGEGALMTWGHVLMLPAMAAVMLLRPAAYAH